MKLTIKDWNIQEMTGYEPKTTFYTDFSIADNFGADAVRDTYQRAFTEWHGNVEHITEFSMALNWKIWDHYESNRALAAVYDELWRKCDAWCYDNLKDDDLAYYIDITD